MLMPTASVPSTSYRSILKRSPTGANSSDPSSLESAPLVPGPSTLLQSVPNVSSNKRPRESNETVQVKKPRLERSVRSLIGNTFSSIEIPVNDDTDLIEFLARVKDEIGEKIEEQSDERGVLKFYLTVKTQLSRTSSDGIEQITTPYFCSISKIVLQSINIGKEIGIAEDRIKELLATHESQGSVFKLDFIVDCQLHVAT